MRKIICHFLLPTLLCCLPYWCLAYPEIQNAGFEEPFTPTGFTGSGPVTGWIHEPGGMPQFVGLSGVAWIGSEANMMDNGVATEGNQVGFLYQGRRDVGGVTAPNKLSQVIPGFRKGKRYIVKYSENARVCYAAPAVDLYPATPVASGVMGTVTLDGKVIDPEHAIAPIESINVHSKPFVDRTCQVFEPTEDGAYKLSFSSYAVSFDATWLIDNIRIIQDPPDPNTVPSIDPIADQSISPGQNFLLTVTGSDTNEPPQKLTFSFDGAVPEGMEIKPLNDRSAEISWRPGAEQANTTHLIKLKVVDDGVGNLSAKGQFVVKVNAGVLLTLSLQSGKPVLNWNAVPNTTYRVMYKNDLNDADWIPAGDPVEVREGEVGTFQDEVSPLPAMRFYRLVVDSP